jgi:hypothetical protein
MARSRRSSAFTDLLDIGLQATLESVAGPAGVSHRRGGVVFQKIAVDPAPSLATVATFPA